MDKNNIGSTLRLLRVASNLRQASLAKDLDVTSNYLSLVENGKKEPSLTFLKKFSRRLDAPLGYLLWIALEDKDRPEEFDLKEKMDRLLTAILEQKNSGAIQGKKAQV